MNDDSTPLERLEAHSRALEALANEVVVRAQAFGAQIASRGRIDLVRQRLKIALDELDAYPFTAEDVIAGDESAGDITDE